MGVCVCVHVCACNLATCYVVSMCKLETYFLLSSASPSSTSLPTLSAPQAVLQNLVERDMPRLSKHMAKHGIDVSLVTINWFLTIFADALPTEVSLYILYCMYTCSNVCSGSSRRYSYLREAVWGCVIVLM